jgi:hypothetical protein
MLQTRELTPKKPPRYVHSTPRKPASNVPGFVRARDAPQSHLFRVGQDYATSPEPGLAMDSILAVKFAHHISLLAAAPCLA